jgi:hypothetical protein
MRCALILKAETVWFSKNLQWIGRRLERQVERLGFANEYFVSLTKGPRGELTKVTPARKS